MAYRGREPKKSCVIKDFCLPFKLNNEILCDFMKRLHMAINVGLAKETHANAPVKCFPTFIQDLPTGQEEGQFLALDLGGSYFRLMLVTFVPEKKPKVEIRSYAIPTELTRGTSDQFFDYLAQTVEIFKTSLKLDDQEYWLGFSFAFPHELTNLHSGILVRWTKNFNVEGVVGQDVCALLQQALDARGLNVKVKALLNDTVGCLMASLVEDPNTRIAVIIGTGTNASYIEKIENIHTVADTNKPFMIVNTEWGGFGDQGALDHMLTEVDREVDQASVWPGRQIFEKMTSVLYVCELIRISFIKCAEKKYLFHGEITEQMRKKGAIMLDYVAQIEKDEGDMLKTLHILENLGLHSVNIVDCVNVRYIVKSICRRSAHLESAAIATLINRISMTPVTVGVDGSMYRYHPFYKEMLMEKVRCMINPKIQFTIKLSLDGGGRGAGIVVASLKRSKQIEMK